LSRHQREAAEVLRRVDLHRACVGRAYYAAYSLVTAELVASGKVFGRFKNPDHSSLPWHVLNGLGSLGLAERRSVAKALRRLRSRREDSDYKPLVSVDDSTARESLKDLAEIRGTMERRSSR
jgi:uncharacterized protein (UPF0332 family)